MLKPNKYTSIELSVLGISTEILNQLSADSPLKYYSLEAKIIGLLGEDSKENFQLALVFLFTLKKIIYYAENDAIAISESLGQS